MLLTAIPSGPCDSAGGHKLAGAEPRCNYRFLLRTGQPVSSLLMAGASAIVHTTRRGRTTFG